MRTPPNPLARALDAATQGPDFARKFVGLLPQAADVLDAAQRAIDRFEAVLDRLERSEARLRAVIEDVSSSERAARGLIDDVSALEQRARVGVERYEPVLEKAHETAAYVTERIGPAEVDAVVAYLQYESTLRRIDEELLPAMATLHTVAPDLTELVAVSRGLNEIMGSLPGLGRVKRRVDEELSDADPDADGAG
ncbi:hypothetical protein [uncultured Jatrophihabitans sp.]|uniref:hypothetical protein n=1 Tax=uncultured Jatrophihabitans sp. TaxID=1610747 RepID=UPI0035CC3EC0